MWSSGTIGYETDRQAHERTPSPVKDNPRPTLKQLAPNLVRPCQIHGSHFATPRYIIETPMLVMQNAHSTFNPTFSY